MEDIKKLQSKAKYLISEDLLDEAREFARDNNLKETEVDTIGISNYYLAAQKAKKYGLYKKAIDFYSKVEDKSIKKDLENIHTIVSKEDTSKLLFLLKKDIIEKFEKNPKEFIKNWKTEFISKYNPLIFN